MKKIILLLTTFLAINSFANVTITKSEINFTAIGKPAFIKASGNMPFKKSMLKVKDNQLSGSILVDLNQLNTGIDLRDEHLKTKYLHVDKFPEAKLVLDPIALVEGSKEQLTMATMYLHGQEKKIKVPLTLVKAGAKITVSSEFELLLSDFAIELPSFQGITAADKVTLSVNSEIEIK
jgi:polyisoprenoid-binding protein YceI